MKMHLDSICLAQVYIEKCFFRMPCLVQDTVKRKNSSTMVKYFHLASLHKKGKAYWHVFKVKLYLEIEFESHAFRTLCYAQDASQQKRGTRVYLQWKTEKCNAKTDSVWVSYIFRKQFSLNRQIAIIYAARNDKLHLQYTNKQQVQNSKVVEISILYASYFHMGYDDWFAFGVW